MIKLLKMTKFGRNIAEVLLILVTGENLLYKWKSEEKSHKTPAETLINFTISQLREQLPRVY